VQFSAGRIPGGHLVAGEVGRGDQRVGMVGTEGVAALVECFLTEFDRFAELGASHEVGGVIDVRRQCERVFVTVDLEETLSGLIVKEKCHVPLSRHPQHRCQIHLDGVEENFGSA
jgi:hypothetical protein